MIELRHLTKTFPAANTGGAAEKEKSTFDALHDVNLTVRDGEIYGIIGMSGAGKSTLVRCINMLERPTEGQVLIDGRDIGALSPKELRAVRRDVTMIFQGFNLLMQRTCLANVCFPLELSGMKRSEAEKRASELLETVGLPDKANAYPAQLSGGQQQRIAIARALATNPKILLCDEATSALDPNTTHAILALIKKINREFGITVVIITHQMSVVEEVCGRVAILDRGVVVEEGEVAEVFARPKTAAAKRLVFPAGGLEAIDAQAPDETVSPAESLSGGVPAAGKPGERVVRIVFNGSGTADKPLITQMAIDIQVAANILFASTRIIGGKVYGNMLLGLPGDGDAAARAITYLSRDPDITVEDYRRSETDGTETEAVHTDA